MALFCGLRRGELRGLQWSNVDFDNGVIRVERSWDPVKGPVDVKTGAGRRAVPMAFVVRRELMAHKQRTQRDGADLVVGRTKAEASSRPRSEPAPTRHGRKPGSSRSHRTRRATARSPASSPPASTGSRSRPGPDTATCARPGTATGTWSRAARSKPASASTPT
ncbi:MAG: tyrosine-type recombinase/integrase [Solirubrobacterales bacterium]|nr:tyrosine-type recombinase/integrase [Solirubrobacterales bacterium]